MTRDNSEDQLSFLIRDAVSDVEPTDRLSDLRARTATTSSSRRWWPAAGGAVLAAAAAVTAIAVLGNDPAPTVDPGPATTPSATDPAPSDATPTENDQQAVPAYFVGDTPQGPRLYREFQPVSSPTLGLTGLSLLESGPLDPDYTSLWPSGSFGDISDPVAGVVYLELTDAAPSELSDLALQQVVYTLSAAFQESLQVDVHGPSGPRDDIGPLVATATPAPQLDVLSKVNLSDPSEGQVAGDTLSVSGRANSFEANVLWTIKQDDVVVDQDFFTADGWMGERLFPFSGEIDVSSLDPGTYTLIVETDDPSGGVEGNGPFSDTRTFVLE